MVKFSAITLPALLAALATLSAAAPTPNTRSDIVATANAVAARDVEPVDFSANVLAAREVSDDTVESVSIEARHNYNHHDHWDYYGYCWQYKNGKWCKGEYSREHDQGYKYDHHMSYYNQEGWRYEWSNNQWCQKEYNYKYDCNYWKKQYKRDVSEVEARDVEVESSDFAIEARHNYNHHDHWDYYGYCWQYKNGKWCKGEYSREHDQGYKYDHHMSYYNQEGWRYEWSNNQWCQKEYNYKYDCNYWKQQ